MADMAHGPRATEPKPASGGGEPFVLPLFAVVLVAAALAGVAGHLLSGAAGWAAAALVAVFGGVVAGVASGGASGGGESRARLLVNALRSEIAVNPRTPAGWTGAWSDLYERLSELSQGTKLSEQARGELERARRQIELATKALRDGKDPLIEIAELRVGPLRELLEVARDRAGSGPIVNRIPLGEEELVGVDGEPLPEPWPKDAEPRSGVPDPRISEAARRGLDELIRGLEALADALGRGGDSAPAAAGAARTPAQLVDAVVHTAADGIEDLAAGLMRANELAAVAERVTNKATLLALNAALEATRSGSEAFAAIAEETRRLAEFAREATDTISRLSSEIEYKVGETITAIHATSEDAKSAVAALPAADGAVASAPPAVSHRAVEALLRRAREIRDGLGAPAAATPPAAAGMPHPSRRAEDAAPETRVGLEAAPISAPAAKPGDAPAEPGSAPAEPRGAAPGDAPGATATDGGSDGTKIPLLDGLLPGSGFGQ